MIYFVYKNENDVKSVQKMMEKDNMFLYNTSLPKDRIEYTTSFISYSDINNKELLKKINNSNYSRYDTGDDIYYKLYGIETIEALEELQKYIFDLVVFYTSGDDHSLYFHMFFDSIYNDLYSKMTGKPRERDIIDDIADLGILAFSTRPDTMEHNNLIEAALDDRDIVRDFYDYLMGEGSFNEINKYAEMIMFDYALNYKNVSSYEFNKLIDGLREYFYKYIGSSDILSDEEKNQMYSKFEEAYNNLKEKQKEHQANKKK